MGMARATDLPADPSVINHRSSQELAGEAGRPPRAPAPSSGLHEQAAPLTLQLWGASCLGISAAVRSIRLPSVARFRDLPFPSPARPFLGTNVIGVFPS